MLQLRDYHRIPLESSAEKDFDVGQPCWGLVFMRGASVFVCRTLRPQDPHWETHKEPRSNDRSAPQMSLKYKQCESGDYRFKLHPQCVRFHPVTHDSHQSRAGAISSCSTRSRPLNSGGLVSKPSQVVTSTFELTIWQPPPGIM
ncbi:hypothetical protein EYF80_001244 [Liparis tanakae]|uniref:Uncharacterized protein n=1 Tax=Liparis tanakae TaxID=230148 RepID=A0A4Z2JGU4_9TELE|nr:hypothetical protein EYF80_001244 [Liparis tanakae]